MALVSAEELYLWVHSEKITQEILDYLNAPFCENIKTCVELNDITDALTDLASWVGSQSGTPKLLVTKPSMYLSGASYAVYESIPEESVDFDDSPILTAKNMKNDVSAIRKS